MKKILIAIVLTLSCFFPLKELFAAGAPVIVVNDLDDSVEELSWRADLNLLDVSLLRERSAFIRSIEIISHGTLKEVRACHELGLR